MMDIVSPLLKLVPFIWEQLEKELKVPENAEKKIMSLEESIGVIERFLTKANSMEILTEDLKASVKRARKFLYAFEDAIDDFTRREGERKWEGLLADFFHHLKRRNFASGAGHILPMVDDYTTMERHAIAEALRGLSGNDAQSSSAGHLSSSIAYSEEMDNLLVGIGQSKEYLVGLLQDKTTQSPKVIFVHGARGVGKTSLVGAVLRDKNVELLFDHYVWIEDLGSCESSAAAIMEANTKMWNLSSANKENPEDHKLKEAFRLIEKAKETTREKRWALVMDDASRVDVFVALESHLNRTRPSVLVTTRVRSLQSSSERFFKSMKAGYASYEFECVLLTETDSQNLFRKNIHQENIHQENIPEDVSKCILKKFNGLPLEILATCDLLNRRPPSATGAPDCVKWKKLSGRLGDALLSNGYEGGPIRRMRAPHKDPFLDVRACLFYLSVFPLGRPIKCSTMIRLWMAEGFIEQKGAQSVQEKAQETLERLLDHYEILEKEKTSCGRVKTCGLPPIWHQQIISESVDEEFTMIVDSPERQWPENVWHLSIHGNMDITYDERWVEQLRSLLVFEKVNLRPLKSLLMNAKRLKVLDLQSHLTEQEKKSDLRLKKALPKIFELKYLRYLSLRGSWVNEIIGDINDLKYLETLDLRDTAVCALPILKLKALRHLLISNRESIGGAPFIESAQLSVPKKKSAQLKLEAIHIGTSFVNSVKGLVTNTHRKFGVKAQSNLRDLTSLQKLCMIKVEPGSQVASLNELGELINLRKLGLSNLKSTDWNPLCSSIQKLTNLEALHLIGAEKQEIGFPDKWKAPESLQRVHLTGHLKISPDWKILPRHRLVKLVLKESRLKTDPLRQLGDFPCLKHLELENAFDFPEIEFCEGEFEKLCFLGLSNFGELKSIKVSGKALWSLERLYIARCTKLTEVPEFITQRIRKFRRLEFCEMHDKFGKWAKQLKSPEVPADMKVEPLRWNGPIREVEIVRRAGGQEGPTMPGHLEKSSKKKAPVCHGARDSDSDSDSDSDLDGHEYCISTSPA